MNSMHSLTNYLYLNITSKINDKTFFRIVSQNRWIESIQMSDHFLSDVFQLALIMSSKYLLIVSVVVSVNPLPILSLWHTFALTPQIDVCLHYPAMSLNVWSHEFPLSVEPFFSRLTFYCIHCWIRFAKGLTVRHSSPMKLRIMFYENFELEFQREGKITNFQNSEFWVRNSEHVKKISCECYRTNFSNENQFNAQFFYR